MSGEYHLNWLCEALMVSRSGYYDWIRRRTSPSARHKENACLREQIKVEFTRSRETYGSPRITRALQRRVSRKRVARLMREEHLRARQRSKYRAATTDSRHADPIAPNRLSELQITRQDQVWATDATYILTSQGWMYVVGMIDVHTRRIVGWAMGDTLDANLMVRALEMAVRQRQPAPGVIVHSDRGTQYASATFRKALTKYALLASMSRKGNCYDNAHIESFWSSLKYEVVYHHRFATKAEARSAVFDYIETFYNRTRMHSALGYVSPAQFESKLK